MGVKRVLLRHAESEWNIPTGLPLVYELDQNLNAQEHYYLGDAEQVEESSSTPLLSALRRRSIQVVDKIRSKATRREHHN